MWGEGVGVIVVSRGGGISGLVLKEHVSGANSKSLVDLPHEVKGGDVRSWWGGGCVKSVVSV